MIIHTPLIQHVQLQVCTTELQTELKIAVAHFIQSYVNNYKKKQQQQQKKPTKQTKKLWD